MEDVIDILMKRDKISKADAQTRIDECKQRLNDEALASGDYELATEIIEDELGLEPDYMMDLIDEPAIVSNEKRKGVVNMSTELMRANRVAVKVDGDNFVADFYRTHKPIGSIHSENTDWEAPADATNKTALRESFRQWVVANCKEWNIEWKPEDMRDPSNIRKAKYETDQDLIDDATAMLIPEMRTLTDKCKYDIAWGGIQYDDITPAYTTGSGKDLSTMGVQDGKYAKSGNWAWADILFMMSFKYKKEECYLPLTMHLVSGQLKKVGIGITEFNNRVRDEILNAGLATAEELDPPKDKSNTSKSDAKEPVVEPVKEAPAEEVTETQEPVSEAPVEATTDVQEPVVEPTEEKPKKSGRKKKSDVKEDGVEAPAEESKPKRRRRAKKNADAE